MLSLLINSLIQDKTYKIPFWYTIFSPANLTFLEERAVFKRLMNDHKLFEL